ncbi:unnamed protein product, partial [Gulo gulo]
AESSKGTWKCDEPEASCAAREREPHGGAAPRSHPNRSPSHGRRRVSSPARLGVPRRRAFLKTSLPAPSLLSGPWIAAPRAPDVSSTGRSGEVLQTRLPAATSSSPRSAGASPHNRGPRATSRTHARVSGAPTARSVPPPPAVKQTPWHGRLTCQHLSPSPPRGRPRRTKRDTGPPRAVGEPDLAATQTRTGYGPGRTRGAAHGSQRPAAGLPDRLLSPVPGPGSDPARGGDTAAGSPVLLQVWEAGRASSGHLGAQGGGGLASG